jgi:hypothetical protein
VSHTCQRCGEAKGADDMVVRGGKPSKTCKACFSASFQKKSGGGKRVTKAKAEPAPEAPPDTGLTAGPALSIAPGLGLEAWIENGCLQVNQGDDVVALSQTEAKVLFAQFSEWAGS